MQHILLTGKINLQNYSAHKGIFCMGSRHIYGTVKIDSEQQSDYFPKEMAVCVPWVWQGMTLSDKNSKLIT